MSEGNVVCMILFTRVLKSVMHQDTQEGDVHRPSGQKNQMEGPHRKEC